MLSKDHNAVHLATAIGCGVAAGWVLGVLYAPYAGAKTRRQLASKTEDQMESIRKKAARWQEEAKDFLDRGQAVVEQGVHLYRTAMR